MKVLMPLLCSGTPHFERQLEIIENHLSGKDKVWVVKCNRSFRYCEYNPNNDCLTCMVGMRRVQIGLNLISQTCSAVTVEKQGKIEWTIPTFRTVEELKDYSYEGIPIGMPVASDLISKYNDADFDTVPAQNEIEVLLAATYHSYLSFYKILEEVEPDIVYIFNGRTSLLGAQKLACSDLGVEFYTHEFAYRLDAYRLCHNCLPHDIEFLRADIESVYDETDPDTARENALKVGLKYRYNAAGVATVFSGFQAYGTLPNNFDTNKKNIAIYNSSYSEIAALPNISNFFGFYESEAEAISKICEGVSIDKDIHIYLRIHPNLVSGSIKQLSALLALANKYKNLTVIPPESTVDSYEILDKVDKVVVFHSSVGAEAAIRNKPVIVLGQAFYRDLGGFYIPRDHNHLVKLLCSTLKPDMIGAIKFYNYMALGGIDYKYYTPVDILSGRFKGMSLDDRVSREFTRPKKFVALLSCVDSPSDLLKLLKRVLSKILKMLKTNQS